MLAYFLPCNHIRHYGFIQCTLIPDSRQTKFRLCNGAEDRDERQSTCDEGRRGQTHKQDRHETSDNSHGCFVCRFLVFCQEVQHDSKSISMYAYPNPGHVPCMLIMYVM